VYNIQHYMVEDFIKIRGAEDKVLSSAGNLGFACKTVKNCPG